VGSIKDQGVSLKGLEFIILGTSPTEIVIFGSDSEVEWRKPLAGLGAENQSVDAVWIKASDGEVIRFLTVNLKEKTTGTSLGGRACITFAG
jgi:hypothetical protein